MFTTTTSPGPSAEQLELSGDSRLWGLFRRAFRLGRSIGAQFYLVSFGLTAGWVVAVFFGAGLFALATRPANLTSGSVPENTNPGGPRPETSWLLQSTDKLDRLSTAQAPAPPQPATAVQDTRAGADPAVETKDERNHAAPVDPVSARGPHASSDQAPVQATVAAVAASEPEPAARQGPPAPVAVTGLPPAPQPSLRRKRAAQERTGGRPPMSHPPTHAIQDVLQKHSRVFK